MTKTDTQITQPAVRPVKRRRAQPLSVDETHYVLQVERARTDRTGLEFCLLALTLDTSRKGTRDELVRVGDFLLERLRITDEVGYLNSATLVAILSATPVAGAQCVAEEIKACHQHVPRLNVQIYSYPDCPWSQDDVGDDQVGEQQGPQVHGVAKLLSRPLPAWKRGLDVTLSSAALLFLLPVLLMIALLVKLSSSGPILFTQRRSGLGGRVFNMLKFRTMVVGAEELKHALLASSVQDGPAFKLEDDPRVTRIGRLLRAMSFDELPQLWHVLRGDMTIVGPRPLPCEETAGCEDWQLERLNVTPGLTCTWQVNGSRVSFADWMRMDIRYLRNVSVMGDLHLMLRTVYSMLIRRDGR